MGKSGDQDSLSVVPLALLPSNKFPAATSLGDFLDDDFRLFAAVILEYRGFGAKPASRVIVDHPDEGIIVHVLDRFENAITNDIGW